ncbi:hypothetical protein [Sphaerospermopsis sp. LEGE 08334]|uniref:hypothetical protein n=1 Tax=Sphaerospermopsis sp. LEGE 08334 TaxID=1828651 RepID=UPI001882B25B|nr:hypothetical protein [Sphaerospermopsis sp. LEGE 08334]MBE9059305.1 hypothetical protein [Sphaerospermopsis sp. LEGE 08334]
MSFSYFEVDSSKGQKYARLYPPKNVDDQLSCQIDFEELQFQKDDVYIYLTGKIRSHSKGIEKSFKEHNCPGETVVIRLLNKGEHETTYKGETKKHTQSTLELFLCNRINALDWDKAYTGMIRFRYDGMLTYLLGDVGMTPDMKEQAEKAAINLTPLENKTIELEPLKNAVGYKGGYGGSKGQTELEKLNDRMAFTLQQMKAIFPEAKLDSIADLIQLLASDGDKPGYVSYCLKTISEVATLTIGKIPF